MTLKQRNRVSAYGAVIAVCALSALASAGHSADAPPPGLPPGQPPGLPCGYEVAAIIQGPPQPALGTFVTGLNEHGWVSGYWHGLGAGSDRAYYWKPAFGESVFTIPLPTGYSRSFALDINDNGLVVGHMSGAGNPSRGFVYDTNTNEMVAILDPIDPAGFNAKCWANAINNDGIVVGARSLGETEQPYNAFIWTPNEDDPSQGTYTDLGVMNGPNSTAVAINHSGVLVGWTGSLGNSDAFKSDIRQEILRAPPEMTTTIALDVSDSGYVAGSTHVGSAQAIRWDLAGEFAILPTPEAEMTCASGAVADDGSVFGSCRFLDQPNVRHGVLWVESQAFNLSDLVRVPDIHWRHITEVNQGGFLLVDSITNGTRVGTLLSPNHAPLGDLTGDCMVGNEDLIILLSEWGNRLSSPADLNGDGIVNGADLALLLGEWDA